ncbi:MAG: hypothetical protein ABL871_19390 [Terricaulis sp.]
MFRTTLLVALAALLLVEPAAARERRNLNVLQENARAIEGGRAVYVLVTQPELHVAINPSGIGATASGGLIGAIIDSSIEQNRANNAEAGITPIRATLFDFNVDAMAIDATNAATSALPWFGGQAVAFGRDNSPYTKNAALDAATANQVAFFEYGYELLPDFSAVRVTASISIANKVAEVRRPEQRLQPRYLAYSQSVISVVQLPNATEREENAARWAANDGALTRQALTGAFNEISVLMPRALQWTDADVEAAADRPRSTNRDYPGARTLEDSGDGALLYSMGGVVHVQTLGQ